MPPQQRHLRAAQQNEELARTLLAQNLSSSWAIVLAFYSALHWVDGFLAASGIHPQSHDQRGRYILRVQQLNPIHVPYRTLESRSRDVRYELIEPRSREAEALLAGELAAIESHVSRLLGL